METIRLETRDGNFVADVLVPPFHPPAEVLLWGERTFVFAQGVIADDKRVYREGILYVVPPLARDGVARGD